MPAPIDDPVLATVLAALDDLRIGVQGFRIHDGELKRLFVSEVNAARLGYTVDEVLAMPWTATLAPRERARSTELLSRVAGGEAPAATLEIDLLHKDGHPVPTEISVTHHDAADGPILVCVFRDIGAQSPRSVLETDRLSVVGALAAGIAHEINNPLTYILLHLRSLRRSIDEWGAASAANAADAAAALRRLDEAYAGAERIRGIVRAVMTFVASPGAQADLDLGAVVQAALRIARPELESRARVVCQIFPVAPVRADEPRLGQAVLSMLLFASAGFAADDPALNRIAIAVEMRGGEVVLEVTDNGRDLTPAEAAHAHEPTFVRSTAEGPSYGLGIARSIAIGAGGRLAIATRPGGGVVVTLSLPAVAHAEPSPPIGPGQG